MALVEISGVNKHFGDFQALKDITMWSVPAKVATAIKRRVRICL